MNKKTELNTTNEIYQFTCPNDDCMHRSTNYIGSTTTTLSRRLTMHLAMERSKIGAIKDHQLTRQNSNLKRENIVCNTVIIRKHRDIIRLLMHEALLIKFKDQI